MKRRAIITTFLAVTLAGGVAFAQDEAPPAGEPAAPPPATTDADDGKKMGIGGDLAFHLPLGDYADATGPQIGPLVRFGYRVIPALEVTGRVGYLFGLKKELGPGVDASQSLLPIWAGARYFFLDPYSGPYAGAELGLNILMSSVTGGPFEASDTTTRFGFTVGGGYVISKDLPIDIRAQFNYLNLLGTKSGEKAAFGLQFSAGYTYQF